MPSTVTQLTFSAALALTAVKWRELTPMMPRWAIPVTAGLFATIPGLDLAGRRTFGIPSSSLIAHRVFFHSPFLLYTAPSGIENLLSRAVIIRRTEIPFCLAAAAIGVLGLLSKKSRLVRG